MSESGLAPGWYPHQETPHALRYWNGQQWTDSVAPMQQQVRPPDRLPDWVSVVGYITMFLFPVVGFVIGIVHLAKSEPGPGVAMIAVSVIAAVFWVSALSSSPTYY